MKNKDPLFRSAVLELLSSPRADLRAIALKAAKEGSFSHLFIVQSWVPMSWDNGMRYPADRSMTHMSVWEPGEPETTISLKGQPNAFMYFLVTLTRDVHPNDRLDANLPG